MGLTQYPEINNLLEELFTRQQKILGDKLVGLYLYGSLVTGDFDKKISDIDLLVAVSSDIDHREFEELNKMHADFVEKYKEWDDRIESQYISLSGLKTFKSHTAKMAVISPGEPFHIVDAGKEWLVNWYMVQEKGITLYGPNPATVIESISKEEFRQTVKEHAKEGRGWIKKISKRRGSQAYAVLTMCRAYYTIKYGEQASKKQAALSMQKEFPEWLQIIQDALKWRNEQQVVKIEDETIYPQTVKFVNSVIDLIEAK